MLFESPFSGNLFFFIENSPCVGISGNLPNMASNQIPESKESKEINFIAVSGSDTGDVKNGESNSIHKGSDHEIAADTIAAASEYTPEQYRKLLRKIDLYLLPVMWVSESSSLYFCERADPLKICYGTQQADKTGISTQAIFGISKDTHLVGQQFSCKAIGIGCYQ